MSTKNLPPIVKYDARGITKKEQLALYKAMLKPRLIEEKMLNLLRQGKISKWFSGIGQEAISVGLSLIHISGPRDGLLSRMPSSA